jgi:iron complex outermembrane recepter protein
MKRSSHHRVAIVLGAVLLPAALGAQATPQHGDLARLSLEDLLNVEITSVSRKEERAAGVAAAVHVITQDDIRRSGIRTLPELFRLVPGVQIAQVNASNWAISIRGFNDVYANKLLVLIDGRSIYNRTFSGVFWSAEDLVLDDIERIEVVRGPGGATWGANAVNGVINIVTKSARETQGALVRLGQGTFDGSQAVLRYGGTFGETAYRLYTQWSGRSASSVGSGDRADDAWDSLASGFRLDQRGPTAVLLTGSFVRSESNPLWDTLSAVTPGAPKLTGVRSTRQTGSVTGRIIRTFAADATLQLQSFFTYREFHEVSNVGRERTADVDVEYHVKPFARHDFVLGGGYRDAEDRNSGSFSVSLTPRTSQTAIANLFAQDEITLHERLRATLGSKFEHDTIAGLGIQPTARLAWDVVPGQQHVWAAVSRARRTPSIIDLGLRANYAAIDGPDGTPILFGALGSPAFRTEALVSTEAGYRLNMRSIFSVDASVFHGRYDRLKTSEPLEPRLELVPGPPHVFVATQFANLLNAETTGLEVAAQWTPARGWRLDGSYTGLRVDPQPDPASRDAGAAAFDGNSPSHQWQVRSTFWLGRRAEVSAALFHVGRIRSLDVPAYTRADLTGELKLRGGWLLAIAGRNLLQPRHVEYSSAAIGMAATEIPKNGSASLVWQF